MNTRPAQHYIISPPKNYTPSNIGLKIIDKLHKEYEFSIWPKFVIIEKDEHYKLEVPLPISEQVLPDQVSAEDVTELLSPLEDFCGDDMGSDFLFESVNKDTNFVMLGYNETDDLDEQIHSILTFSVKKIKDIRFIYIDAICVNNVVEYKGAGYLLKTLINICVSIDEISYIKLYSITTDDTLKFYKKLGFKQTGIKDLLMGQKLNTKELQQSAITIQEPLTMTLKSDEKGGKRKGKTFKKRKGKTFKKRKGKTFKV
jgi:hypothetical protein